MSIATLQQCMPLWLDMTMLRGLDRAWAAAAAASGACNRVRRIIASL
jgi:hypothetical protein